MDRRVVICLVVLISFCGCDPHVSVYLQNKTDFPINIRVKTTYNGLDNWPELPAVDSILSEEELIKWNPPKSMNNAILYELVDSLTYIFTVEPNYTVFLPPKGIRRTAVESVFIYSVKGIDSLKIPSSDYFEIIHAENPLLIKGNHHVKFYASGLVKYVIQIE